MNEKVSKEFCYCNNLSFVWTDSIVMKGDNSLFLNLPILIFCDSEAWCKTFVSTQYKAQTAASASEILHFISFQEPRVLHSKSNY